MNGKILIADDNRSTIESLKAILDIFNYDIEEAVNGIEAQELTEINKYNFVFLDINMPEPSGLELIKWIRESWKKTIVIVITGFIRGIKDLVLFLGAHEYLEKPFYPEDIISIIRKYS